MRAPPGEWSPGGRKARGEGLCRASQWGVSAWLWTGWKKGMGDPMLFSAGPDRWASGHRVMAEGRHPLRDSREGVVAEPGMGQRRPLPTENC